MRIPVTIAACSIALALGVGCNKEKAAMPSRDIQSVQEAHTKELMMLHGVLGTYIGALDDGTPCIGVMVDTLTTELQKKLPKTLDGFPVKIDETGEVRPMK